jgi:hypothetical protein
MESATPEGLESIRQSIPQLLAGFGRLDLSVI